MRVEFHPTASEEFEAASAYYNNEVPGLGAGQDIGVVELASNRMALS
jgi:hypothetical protein